MQIFNCMVSTGRKQKSSPSNVFLLSLVEFVQISHHFFFLF